MLRTVLVGAGVVMAGMALAQGTGPAPPLKTLMENGRVRVIEVTLGARGKVNIGGSERERAPEPLSDGALVFAPPGRASYVLTLNAGEAVWFPPASPTIENEGEHPVRAVVIELRQPAAGIRTAKAKLKAKKAKAKLKARPKAKPSKVKLKGKPK